MSGTNNKPPHNKSGHSTPPDTSRPDTDLSETKKPENKTPKDKTHEDTATDSAASGSRRSGVSRVSVENTSQGNSAPHEPRTAGESPAPPLPIDAEKAMLSATAFVPPPSLDRLLSAEGQKLTPENLQGIFSTTTSPPSSISDEMVSDVHQWLSRGDMASITALAERLLPVDLADLIELSNGEDRQILIGVLKPYITPEVLSCLEIEIREEMLERLAPKEIAAAISKLESDDAVDMVEELDEDQRAAVIAELPHLERRQVEEALSWPEESAGRLMQREVVAVPSDWTVGKTLDTLREQNENLPPVFHDIVIIDPWKKVVGALHLYRLMRAGRAVKVREIMNSDVHHIPVTMDREEIAFIFKRYRLQSAPVVDEEDKLLGVITFDDMVDVMGEVAEEDIRAMSGVGAEESIHDNVIEVTRSRFIWLLINLGTALAASAAIGLFEATLQQVVALAVLMPIVASMGGNAGTQTLTIAVRAMATRDIGPSNYWRLIGRETAIGLINGTGFAVLVGIVAWLWFASAAIGIVIAAAMVINMLAAGFCGAIIPIVLNRFGVDPAVASSVFLTTVTDIVGFVAFLGLATAILL